jgi:UDP-N-acetylmuramate dehydrogenase
MTLPTTALEALTAAFGDRLLFNEPLARHNSARIGGPADVFLTARSVDDLRRAAALAWVHQMPFKLLGRRLQHPDL